MVDSREKCLKRYVNMFILSIKQNEEEEEEEEKKTNRKQTINHSIE
jgi:hypothetical protein